MNFNTDLSDAVRRVTRWTPSLIDFYIINLRKSTSSNIGGGMQRLQFSSVESTHYSPHLQIHKVTDPEPVCLSSRQKSIVATSSSTITTLGGALRGQSMTATSSPAPRFRARGSFPRGRYFRFRFRGTRRVIDLGPASRPWTCGLWSFC